MRRSLLPCSSAVVGSPSDRRVEGKCLVQVVCLACSEAAKHGFNNSRFSNLLIFISIDLIVFFEENKYCNFICQHMFKVSLLSLLFQEKVKGYSIKRRLCLLVVIVELADL